MMVPRPMRRQTMRRQTWLRTMSSGSGGHIDNVNARIDSVFAMRGGS